MTALPFAEPFGSPKKLNNMSAYKFILAYLIALFILFTNNAVTAQNGGRYVYEFLNLSQSARTTALGGHLISVTDEDVALAYANPALLNPLMSQQIALNHNFHFADISHGLVNYGFAVPRWNLHFHAGVNYINYGSFIRADEFGNQDGSFDASETAITLGASRKLNDRITAGLNVKLISSRLDAFSSLGIASDLGLLYENKEQSFTFGAVIKNIGTQLSTYNGLREPLPFDIQLGFSKRLKHLPFRLSITAHTLNRWDIRYDDPNAEDPIQLFDDQQVTEGGFGQSVDNFFRHFTFNGEFLIGKRESFRLRIGYNHLRKKELSVSEFRSLGGFSAGFGFKVKQFRFDYGVGYYHLAGGVNHLSISTNLKEFRKKV